MFWLAYTDRTPRQKAVVTARCRGQHVCLYVCFRVQGVEAVDLQCISTAQNRVF